MSVEKLRTKLAQKFGKYLDTCIDESIGRRDIEKELIVKLIKKITRLEDQSVILGSNINFM